MERYTISLDWKTENYKNAILLKLIYRFNKMPIKIPPRIFIAIDKINLNFMWQGKRTRIGKTILKNKDKIRKISLPILKTYCINFLILQEQVAII